MRIILALTALLLLAPPALAQPGPGPTPDPWILNGNSVTYPGGVVVGNPAGGSEGSGKVNVSGGYYVGGVLLSGMPFTPQGDLLCNLASGSQVPTACSWTAYASLAIGTTQNQLPLYSGSAWGSVTLGKSVANPGSGALEALQPIQSIAGTSRTFAAADLELETRRSNSGAAMTDTFPLPTVTGMANGTRIVYANVDVTATATITAGSGTTMSNGLGSETVGPGRSVAYVYDSASTEWRRSYNTGTALLGPNNLMDVGSIATARANLIPAGTITNTQLANSSVTFNGVSCSLGSSCTITATAASITAGSTTVTGGPGILQNASSGGGLISALTLPSGVSAPSFTVTTAFTATGLVTNADLVNPSVTLGSTTLTLGSTVTTVAGLTLTSPTLSSPAISTPTITGSFTATGLVKYSDINGGSIANTSNYTSGAASALVPASVIYTAETTTTYGTTTTFDFSTFLNTAVTLTGPITTQTLSNVKAGQSGVIRFIQDGTGGRTTVWNSIFKFAGGVTPTLSTAAGASDDLFYTCMSATRCDASLGVNFK